MMHLAYDSNELALLQVATGPFEPSTIEPLLALADRFQREANQRGRPGRWLTIIEDRAEPPDALSRKRLATATPPFQKLHCAVVTTSALHRAVITGLRWLTPAKPGQLFAEFARFDDAVRWMEGLAGGPMPCWERLLSETKQGSVPRQQAAR